MNCHHSPNCLIDDEFNLRVTSRCSTIFDQYVNYRWFDINNPSKWYKIDNLPPLLQVIELMTSNNRLLSLTIDGQLLYIDRANQRGRLIDCSSIDSPIKYIDYWELSTNILVIIDSQHRIYVEDIDNISGNEIQPLLLGYNVESISQYRRNGFWLSESSIFGYNGKVVIPYNMNGIRIDRLISQYPIDYDGNIYYIDTEQCKLVNIHRINRRINYKIKDIDSDHNMILDDQDQLHTSSQWNYTIEVKITRFIRMCHYYAYLETDDGVILTPDGQSIHTSFKLFNIDEYYRSLRIRSARMDLRDSE